MPSTTTSSVNIVGLWADVDFSSDEEEAHTETNAVQPTGTTTSTTSQGGAATAMQQIEPDHRAPKCLRKARAMSGQAKVDSACRALAGIVRTARVSADVPFPASSPAPSTPQNAAYPTTRLSAAGYAMSSVPVLIPSCPVGQYYNLERKLCWWVLLH